MNSRIRALIVSAVSATSSLNAAVLTVTSLADSGSGSLRDQVAASSAGDTIQFAVTGTILLSSAINITHSLTIQGPGPADLTVDANHVDRVFLITVPGTGLASNSIYGMTITNGFVTGTKGADGGIGQNGSDGGDAYGGGIYATNTQLTISNCWLTFNVVEGGQGGEGGANVIGVTYFRPGTGGNGGLAEGGALYYLGNYEIAFLDCTLSDNFAIGGAGGKGGTNVASSLDSGGTGGSGGEGQAGAVQTSAYVTFFDTCTLSENHVGGGRGGAGGDNTDGGTGGTGGNGSDGAAGAFAAFSGGSFQSCTIVSNSALGGPGGPGGSGATPGPSGSASSGEAGALLGYTLTCNNPIANTILADNSADSAPNFVMAFRTGGHNFIGSDDCGCCPWTNSDLVGGFPPIHPQLLPLVQNGGGLPTHATTLTSPVTDQGYSVEATDERGAPRVYDWPAIPNNGNPPPPPGNGADIGAYELGTTDLGAGVVSNNLVLSWPAYYGDFVLQSAASLQGSNAWSNVPATPVVISNQNVITVPMTNGIQFYRLVNQ